MYTAHTHDNVRYLTEWHLCYRCFRWVNFNQDSHVIAVRDGYVYYQHIHCQPLKQGFQPLLAKED